MALIAELLSAHPSPTFVGWSPGEEDAGDNSRSPEEDEDEDVDEEEMLVCVRGLEAEMHAMESGADHSEEELRAAMARLRTASEAVFRNLEDLYGDVVMCPEGESMLGISTPEGRLYFAATRDLVYTMRELIRSGVVGVNAPDGFKVRQSKVHTITSLDYNITVETLSHGNTDMNRPIVFTCVFSHPWHTSDIHPISFLICSISLIVD